MLIQSYLCGVKPSLPDIAIFPFIRQFAFIDKSWFDQQNWLRLQVWLEHFLVSELFLTSMGKYSNWKPSDRITEFPENKESDLVGWIFD